MIKYFVSIFFIIIFINSCSFVQKSKNNFQNIKHKKFDCLNFNTILENIISDLIKTDDILISKNNLFFFDYLKNYTNKIIDEKKLSEIIKNKIIKNNSKITFVEEKIINENKKKMGLLNTEQILSTATSILLSRNNHAKYYLEGKIFREKNLFFIKMTLILVQTGEVIFSKTNQFCW